ncbi:MAG: M48 family metallopeptidase [Hyphomicrobiales bacterium]|nr:M48 family metallopeptidase [Hyphomicrobiales bacterium]
MDRPLPTGVFLDGVNSRKRHVELRAGLELEIIENGEVIAKWPWDKIHKADAAPGDLRLLSEDAGLARLTVTDPEFARSIATHAPKLYSGVRHRTSTMRIVMWSVAAAISLLVVGLFGVPYAADKLAPLLPLSVDRKIGVMVDNQVRTIFGAKTCDDPAGRQAYDHLVAKLITATDLKVPLQAAVLNSAVKNAIALPGGRVYFFRGLLDVANSPDEVAGVMAHELGHVHHRDSLRKMLQAGGSSFLLGLLFGDVTGAGAVIFAARTLLDRAYTRKAENRADGFAIDAMKRLGRSAVPMGELLVRITGKQGATKSSILASHPFSEDRLARMKRAAPKIPGPELLTAAQWQALKGICRNAGPPKPLRSSKSR